MRFSEGGAGGLEEGEGKKKLGKVYFQRLEELTLILLKGVNHKYQISIAKVNNLYLPSVAVYSAKTVFCLDTSAYTIVILRLFAVFKIKIE